MRRRRLLEHHESPAHLRLAAQEGCYICINLLEWFEQSPQDLDRTLEADQRMALYGRPTEIDAVDSYFVYKVTRSGLHFLLGSRNKGGCREFAVFDLLDEDRVQPLRSTPAGGFTGGQDSIDTLRTWLARCKSHEDHSTCRVRVHNWNPTRLLQLRRDVEHEHRITVRLTLPSQYESVPYTALSHRWGGVPTSRLLQANLHDFAGGVLATDIPQTFRDACYVTLELGLEHVWIDSLCIIQDSPEDWQHESALMYLVYANAEVCIAASAAENSSQGLFFERDAGLLWPPTIDLRYRGDAPERRSIKPDNLWFRNVEASPLNQRAW